MRGKEITPDPCVMDHWDPTMRISTDPMGRDLMITHEEARRSHLIHVSWIIGILRWGSALILFMHDQWDPVVRISSKLEARISTDPMGGDLMITYERVWRLPLIHLLWISRNLWWGSQMIASQGSPLIWFKGSLMILLSAIKFSWQWSPIISRAYRDDPRSS